MAALGQERTFAAQNGMSALTPKADMCSAHAHVCFGPKADIDGLRGPLTERFNLRQELCRIPSIC
jgi:hypothetical protein